MKTTTALESAVNSRCNNQNNLSTTFSPHFQQPKLQSYQQQHLPQHQNQWNNFRVRISKRKNNTNCFMFLNKKYWDIVGVSCCQFIVVEIKSSAIWRPSGHVFLSDSVIRTNYHYHYLSSLSYDIFPTCDPNCRHRTTPTEQSGPQTPRGCLFTIWSQYTTLILCPITR